MNIHRLHEIIRECLLNEQDVRLVFLFGSMANGLYSSSSDLDLALLFQEKPGFHYLRDIEERISKVTGRELDLLVLNEASPIIRM